jgi:dTDP-4-amino-4,6-dideoxygalactose transaminase
VAKAISSVSPPLLHVGRPNIGDRDMFDQFVRDIFERRWFTNYGQLVQELEARLADFLGVRNCIVVCNATVGMQLVCHALELTGEVIVPAFTFVATPHAAQWERLRIVFAEPRRDNHLIDPDKIEALVTPQTSAIFGVHVWGQPCDTQAIESIAQRHRLRVMYDAAHAFGCRHRGKMIGNFGDCEVFSFHSTKFFNTFEGGAITTNDDALAQKIRLMTNFGFAKLDHVIHLGTNAKMTEICAAMGLSCLARLDDFLAVYKSNYEQYREAIADIRGLSMLDYDQLEGTNWQYIVVEVDEDICGISRDAIVNGLRELNIWARRYFHPGCHRMEPYRTLYPEQLDRLPITDELCSKVMCLPTGTAVSAEDIQRVCDTIRRFLATRG